MSEVLPYTLDPDVEASIRRLVLTALREQPRSAAQLKAWADEMQVIEEALFALLLAVYNPDGAGGHALDIIGRVAAVGRRGGLSDSRYRRIVKLGILANRTGGTRQDVVTAARIASATDEVSYRDAYPAAYLAIALVSVYSDDVMTSRLAPLLTEVAQAGVSGSHIEQRSDAFTFGSVSPSGAPSGAPVFDGSTAAAGTFAHALT